MKLHLPFRFLALLVLAGLMALPVGAKRVKTGIEVLRDHHFDLLQGKHVGLVTNPTGVDANLVSDVDILAHAPGVKLVALFGPEHGVRGAAHAGAVVVNDTDEVTGLPVYSLFGKNRKPNKDMLRGIDMLVYDIQDIGCRSFTYISTLASVMQSAAENHIPLVVLDRPNPLGGLKVEGNLVEDDCRSFVSLLDIPYIYGLTPGELARLLNAQAKESERCQLTVVKMKGWKRKMTFEDTGLPWVLSSPHIPEASTAPFYALSGIVGELDNFSIGVGYTLPFKVFGASWIKANELADAMNALHIPGVLFRPIYYTPFYGPGKGQMLQGVQVYFTDYAKAPITSIQFLVLQELYRLYPDHDVLQTCSDSRKKMIDKVCGSKQIRQLFLQHHRWSDAKPYWDKDAEAFKAKAKKYWLY